jgi:hypothetical protein
MKKIIKILAYLPFLRWIFDLLGFDFGIEEDFEIEENPFNLDVNGDGVTDAIGTDLDGDGVVDHLSIDSDGDGVVDTIQYDYDGDGIMDEEMVDLDGDGEFGSLGDEYFKKSIGEEEYNKYYKNGQ